LSDHTSTFVSLDSWCYNSPELQSIGKTIDVGLLAEALIYYDHVYLNVGNQPQFAELLQWFVSQDKFFEFLTLVREGVITIYEYSFASVPILKDGVYILGNIQDETQKNPDTFEKRFLYHPTVQSCFDRSRDKEKLYTTLRGHVIEAKAEDFGAAIENAREDFGNVQRHRLTLQAFVDELYAFRKLGPSPNIQAHLKHLSGERQQISWNIDFGELTKIAGKELNFHNGTPLAASAVSNRLILSASKLGSDLYLGSPGSIIVGDKLFESNEKLDQTKGNIEDLQTTVEFPELRQLVNSGKIGIDEILYIRSKAKKFRNWLQDEADRDRDAIVAYHHEVAKESGLIKYGRKSLNLFGVVGGAALGAAVGDVTGAVAGASTGYLLDIASRLGTDWRPVVFGNWYRDRIEKVLRDEEETK